MPALTLLKRISSALFGLVMSTIDYVQYLWEEVQGINRPDWQEGELRKVIDDLEIHHTTDNKLNLPEHKTAGKINMRLMEDSNDRESMGK